MARRKWRGGGDLERRVEEVGVAFGVDGVEEGDGEGLEGTCGVEGSKESEGSGDKG